MEMHSAVFVIVRQSDIDETAKHQVDDYINDVMYEYDEGLIREEYLVGDVSDDAKLEMVQYYFESNQTKSKNFDYVYKKFGDGWNDNAYRKDDDGVWREYSTRNQDGKWDYWSYGGRWHEWFDAMEDDDTEGCTINVAQAIMKVGEDVIPAAVVYKGQWIDLYDKNNVKDDSKYREILLQTDKEDLVVLLDIHN